MIYQEIINLAILGALLLELFIIFWIGIVIRAIYQDMYEIEFILELFAPEIMKRAEEQRTRYEVRVKEQLREEREHKFRWT